MQSDYRKVREKEAACESTHTVCRRSLLVACLGSDVFQKDPDFSAQPNTSSQNNIVTIHITMSTPRRRIFGGRDDDPPASSRDSSPAPAAPKEAGGDAYRIVPKERLEKLKRQVKPRGGKRRNAWIFGLGGLFGLLAAGFFAGSNGGIDKLITMAGLEEMNLDSVLDVLPTGLIRDIRDLQVCATLIVLLCIS